jgi:hypothetical protein
MPNRNDLDPRVLRPWIGNLALIEISIGGDAQFRLCGTNLHGRFGGEFTRRSVTTLDAQIGESVRDCIDRVCSTKAPAELTHERVIDGERKTYRELGLPLSDDAARLSIVLFASYPAKMK